MKKITLAILSLGVSGCLLAAPNATIQYCDNNRNMAVSEAMGQMNLVLPELVTNEVDRYMSEAGIPTIVTDEVYHIEHIYTTNYVSVVTNTYHTTVETNIEVNITTNIDMQVIFDNFDPWVEAASNQAVNAASSAQTAIQYAGIAETKANLASQYANNASNSASRANTYVSEGINSIDQRLDWFDDNYGKMITNVNINVDITTNMYVAINKNTSVEIDENGNVYNIGQSDLSAFGAPTTIIATNQYNGSWYKLMGIAKAIGYVYEISQTTEMFFYAYENDRNLLYETNNVRVPYIGPSRLPTLSITLVYNKNTGKWGTYAFINNSFLRGNTNKDSVFVEGESLGMYSYTLFSSSEFIGNYTNNTKFLQGKVVVDKNLATVAKTGSYNDLTNKPNFATVAYTGSYNDLTDKPTLPDFEAERLVHKVLGPLRRQYKIELYNETKDVVSSTVTIQSDLYNSSRDYTILSFDWSIDCYISKVTKISNSLRINFNDFSNVTHSVFFAQNLNMNDDLSMPALNSKTGSTQYYGVNARYSGYCKMSEITDLEREMVVDYFIDSDFNVYDVNTNVIDRLILKSVFDRYTNYVENTFQKL